MPTHASPHATVLTREELQRMKDSTKAVQPDNHEEIRRKQLKKLSQDRLQHWPNTLEALRIKKESWAKDKAEEEENKRREVDIYEAEMRKQERLQSIRRANDMLYEQTGMLFTYLSVMYYSTHHFYSFVVDKMKLFRGQQRYCDILVDRFAQIERKKAAMELDKTEDKVFHEKILETVKVLTDTEEAKKKKIEDNIAVIAKVREEQLNQVRSKREAERQESIAIGEAMKKQAKEHLEMDLILQQEKQKKIEEGNAQMVIANEKLKAVRAEISRKEKIATEEREGEVEVIENRKKARKVIEIRRFEKQQETRQKIIEAAMKQLAEKGHKDNAIQMKQEKEIRDREDKAIADKETKRLKQWNQIVDSRTEQIETRNRKKKEEYDQDMRQIALWNDKNQAEIEKARNREEEARKTTTTIKTLQYVDGIKVARKKIEDKMNEIESDKMIKDIGVQDDKKFSDIVRDKIMEYAAVGKPIYPMIKALEYKQPDLMGPKPKDKGKNK